MNTNRYTSGIAKSLNPAIPKKGIMFPFYLILVFLFFEYARPQLLIPVLHYFHIPAVTVILMSVSMFFAKKLYLKDKQTILYILLLVEMVIHGPIAVNNYWAFQVFYSMSTTFIVYIAIINFVDSSYKYDQLIRFWLKIFIVLAVIGIIKRGIGVGGFIGDENDFCMALNMIIPFSLFGIFSEKRLNGKLYLIFLSCLFLYVIILTDSRGGFVGLVSVAVYCWLKSNKKVVVGVLMVIFIMFAVVIAPQKYWDEVRSITTENTAANPYGTGAQRIYAWRLGWHMFLDNPVIGVGQGNYPWRVWDMEQKLGVQWHERSLAGRAAHSLYFTLFSELGIVGTLIYGFMVFFSMKNLSYIKKRCKKQKSKADESWSKVYYLALALEGSLVGFLTSSVFISTLYYPNFWILCAFILSLKKIVASDLASDNTHETLKAKFV